MFMGYVGINHLVYIHYLYNIEDGLYMHFSVGFCVARSTGLGNARALNSGMSN